MDLGPDLYSDLPIRELPFYRPYHFDRLGAAPERTNGYYGTLGGMLLAVEALGGHCSGGALPSN
jgi:hypothetical protein